MARIKDDSVREVVGGRRHGRGRLRPDVAAQGGRALLRPLPVPRGADAELLGQPGRQALPLLRLRQGRRRDHVRPRDREPRLRRRGRVARRALPRHARVRGDLAAARGVAEAARPAARACSTRRRRSTSATSGSRPRARRCATTSTSRGLGEEVCREFRLGLSPGEAGSRRRRSEKGFTRDELRGAGLTQRARQRLLPAAADVPARRRARARSSASRRGKLHEDDPLQGKYVNSPEGELFHKSAILYGLAPRADGDREAGARGRRRGQHGRDRAAPGRVRARRRLDGHGADRAAAEGAAAAHAPALSLLRLRRGRGGGDAARHGARDVARASTCRVVTLPKGQDPADAPDGFEARLGGAESYVLYRVRLELDRTPDRQEAFVRAREILQRNEDSPEWQDALRLLAGRLEPAEGDALRADAEGRRADARRGALAEAARERASGSSATRSPPASRIRAACSCSRSSRRSTSTRSCTAASASTSSTAASDDEPDRAPGRARRPRGARGARRANRQGAAAAPARAAAAEGRAEADPTDDSAGAEAIDQVRAAIEEL